MLYKEEPPQSHVRQGRHRKWGLGIERAGNIEEAEPAAGVR